MNNSDVIRYLDKIMDKISIMTENKWWDTIDELIGDLSCQKE